MHWLGGPSQCLGLLKILFNVKELSKHTKQILSTKESWKDHGAL